VEPVSIMGRDKDKRRVGTLGDIVRAHCELWLCCERPSCWRQAKMSVEDLIARFGAAFPLQAALELAVCSKCGARWPEVGCQRVPKPEHWAGPRDHKVTPLKSQPSFDRPNLGGGQDGSPGHGGAVDPALRIVDHNL